MTTLSPETLIEKFATMVEEGALLNERDIADKTIEIMVMISMEPDLGETMNAINAKLRSILVNVGDPLFRLENTPQYIASQIRNLKSIPTPSEQLH